MQLLAGEIERPAAASNSEYVMIPICRQRSNIFHDSKK